MMEASEAAKNALTCVYEAKEREKILIFCDDTKMNLGEAFAQGALKLRLQTRLVQLKTDSDMRKEVKQDINETISKYNPDICINIFRGDREETPFRLKFVQIEKNNRKIRLGHCPGLTLDMLTEGALAMTTQEHRGMQTFAFKLMQKLQKTATIKITNPAGTRISLNFGGRRFITDTIIDWENMLWMNLPTGEVYAGPIENSLTGKFVCDMAIGGIGPIKTPVTLDIKDGKVQNIESEDKQVLKEVKDSLGTDKWSDVIGEFAFGINSKARLVEEFLESEKMMGTIHIAFGNNKDMPGGRNESQNHLDLMISKPSAEVFYEDKSNFEVLTNGKFASL
jgi:aminopeptidase